MTLEAPKRVRRQQRSPKRGAYGPHGSQKPPKVAPLLTGRQLAEMRTRAGLSQAELARRIGQLRQTVYHWEREDWPIPAAHYRAILDTLTSAKAERDELARALIAAS